eukprot:11164153-Lingulodinium_polyedra.AAC.1
MCWTPSGYARAGHAAGLPFAFGAGVYPQCSSTPVAPAAPSQFWPTGACALPVLPVLTAFLLSRSEEPGTVGRRG